MSKLNDKDLKNMKPPEGKGLIYLIRSRSTGTLIKFKVFVNDEYIGATKGKNFLYKIVDPGHYKILSKAENQHEIEFEVEAGKIYYVLQKIRLGVIKARVRMYLTDEGEGRTRLKKCKLSKVLPKE